MNIKNELKFASMRSAILSEAASFDAKGRKKIIVAFLLLLLGIAAPQYGKVIGTLPVDYLKLPILRMDSHQVYVVDKLGKKGYIFDRKTLKKVAEFGKPGEGPFEFKGISGFHIDEKYLYVSASLKLSIFAKNGRPVKEIKEDTFIYDIIPCGKYFIGQKNLPAKRGSDEVTIRFNLYDSNMQIKKEIFLTTIHAAVHFKKGKRITHLVNDRTDAFVYDNLLIIGSTGKGFYFAAFNNEGEKLYEITKNREKEEITAAQKRQIYDNMQKHYGKERWKAFTAANEIEIPDFLPAYQTFFVDDGKIYVFCHPTKDGQEVIIMDLTGGIVAREIVPEFIKININAEYDCLIEGKLYIIIGNEDGEKELHVFNLPGALQQCRRK